MGITLDLTLELLSPDNPRGSPEHL